MVRLTQIKALPGHRLHLQFSDGVSGEVDLTARLFGPVFEPLKDEAFFARVSIGELGAPSWPNGADLAPDALHERLERQASAAADAASK
jgi:hypothetical protein